MTTVLRVLGEHELDDAWRDAITALIDDATAHDGIGPVDDQVRLDLLHPSATSVHVIVEDGDLVLGYANLDMRADTTASGHLVVAPRRRREGIGRQLANSMVDVAAGRRLAVWAHGDGEGAKALSSSLGWQPIRELRQLILHRATAIPEPSYPADVIVRTFEPGRDEQAWVDVNAAAFANHPEQGRMTVSDLEQREEQPWFDPAGLFLAERDGALLGSHWTKIHEHDDGGRVGEVYVVGVSPQAQGLGLGKALTLTGLHFLRDQGLDVILYVDADNPAAVRLYEGLGFETAKVDIQYAPKRSTEGS